jgi:fatty acid desaturase
MLKNKKDLRVLLWLFSFGIFHALILLDIPFFYLIKIILSVHITFASLLINHNHRHCEIFKNKKLNFCTNVYLTLLCGAPSSRTHYLHFFDHHINYPSEKDFQNPHKLKSTVRWKRALEYIPLVTKGLKRKKKDFKRHFLSKAARVENLFLLVYVLLFLFLNVKSFLIVIVPGWIIGVYMALMTNVLSHDECNINSIYTYSRDFDNRFENWIFFNSGYHSVHHIKPGLHWSKLPATTNELRSKGLLERGEINSMLVYFFKYFTS